MYYSIFLNDGLNYQTENLETALTKYKELINQSNSLNKNWIIKLINEKGV